MNKLIAHKALLKLELKGRAEILTAVSLKPCAIVDVPWILGGTGLFGVKVCVREAIINPILYSFN